MVTWPTCHTSFLTHATVIFDKWEWMTLHISPDLTGCFALQGYRNFYDRYRGGDYNRFYGRDYEYNRYRDYYRDYNREVRCCELAFLVHFAFLK